MFVVKEYVNDGYEDWCVNQTEFETEKEADVFADDVFDSFCGYPAGHRVTVEEIV